MNKFATQENEYIFPYHWIPNISMKKGKESACVARELWWGYEYLAYMLYVANKLVECNCTKILDVGCGDGRFANIYYQTGGTGEYTGVDASEKAISLARAMNNKLDGEKVRFKVEDISIIDEREEYDGAVLIEVLEHIPDEQIGAFLQGICARLKPGAKLYVTVPSVNIPLQSKHYRHYTKELLTKHLENVANEMRLTDIRYVLPQKRSWELYKKATMNKWWSVHFHSLDERFFHHLYMNIEKNNGHCRKVFACIEKMGEKR